MKLSPPSVVVLSGLIFLLFLTGAIYSKGVNGPFVLDDNWNIVNNDLLHIDTLNKESLVSATFSGNAGTLKRPISMLSFALNFYFLGDQPAGFKQVNIIIHLINGVLIFFFIYWLLEAWRQLYRPEKPVIFSSLAGLIVSGLWLVHPLNVSTVLYVVQRMTSLCALFTFLGLALYVRGRISLFNGNVKMGTFLILSGAFISPLLAALSKENGVLLIFLIALCEIVIFRFRASLVDTRISSKYLRHFITIYAGLPAIAGLFLLVFKSGSLLNYDGRDFTLVERLLTQGRILIQYMQQIILPDISQMGLFHDGIKISTSWSDPATTGPAVITCLLLLFIAFLFIRKIPLLSFGLLFFFIGHSLESTIFPLELVFEHRNYLPMTGIILIVVLFIFRLFEIKAGSIALFILIIFFTTQTSTVVSQWSRIDRFYEAAVKNHPESPRAHQGLAGLYLMILQKNDVDREAFFQLIRKHYLRSYELRPDDGSGLSTLIRISWDEKEPVKPEWLEKLAATFESNITNNKLRCFRTIMRCEAARKCYFGRDYIERILNSTLHSAKKGEKRIAFLAAEYYAAIGEIDRAIKYVERSLELERNRKVLILYSNLLMTSHHPEKAREILLEAERMDKFGVSRKEIAELRERWSGTSASPESS